jgi:2,4-dienoyl-CoA reductase-like NADH-dependent reductase (Old Yellow Enzyme family)
VPHPHLLSPGRLGALTLRNRLVMAPMGANLAEADGHAGERMKEYFEARARGGVGLVIVDVAAVAWPAGASNPFQLGLSSDEFVDDLADLASRVHRHGAAIAIQLHHGGKVAVRDIVAGREMWVPSVPAPKPMDLYDDLSPEDLEAATGEIIRAGNPPRYHEMSLDDIATARDWYASAADRAHRAGFDGVELHAGHGYLLQSFLSPASNHRTDEYGGALEARARFLLETIRDVRHRCGADFAVWVRLDGCEYGIAGGITEADARRTAVLCAEAGADAVHASAYADPGTGAAFTVAPLPHQPAAYLELARGIKDAVDVPVIAVGRLEPDAADAAIADGACDFVAMGRKLLADPDLPRKLAQERAEEIRPCIYAYRCVGNIFLSKRTRCVVNPATGREHEVEITPADAPRRVLVVGGGPAGMETARLAAERGHDVVLIERAVELGGLAAVAAVVDERVADLVEWQRRGVLAAGVDVRLGTAVTRPDVDAVAPDVVVLATGRTEPPTALAATLERLRSQEPTDVAVVGGDAIAVKVAEHLVEHGHRVTVVRPDGIRVGSPLAPPRLWRALAVLRGRGTVFTDAVPAGALVVEVEPGEAAAPLAGEIASGPWETHTVGDCRAARYLDGAFDDAWDIALRI